MRTLTAFLAALLLSFASSPAHGTTWAEDKVRDPVSGKRIKVSQPASSGSYIYNWPEKVDQVFWPYTAERWLWFSPRSGYIAFGDDFEELDPSKLKDLKAWLKANYKRRHRPRSRLELLAWAEKVYSVRGMDEKFWCHFYRLMAYETRADASVSLGYVRKALPLLESKLAVPKAPPAHWLETLYLLSEYNRRLGNEAEAADYLEKLTSFRTDEDLSHFKSYLLDIAREQRARPSD